MFTILAAILASLALLLVVPLLCMVDLGGWWSTETYLERHSEQDFDTWG